VERIGARPVAVHSSGNFASGIAFAGMRFKKRVIVVMPETAPRVKFERTRSFGAEIRTYDIARDHETGERDRLTREIAEGEGAIQASPYDDPHVIAGNGRVPSRSSATCSARDAGSRSSSVPSAAGD